MPVKAWKLGQHRKRYFQAKYHKTLDVEELLTVEDKNVPILVPYVRKFSFFCLVKRNPYLQHFPKVALLFQAEIVTQQSKTTIKVTQIIKIILVISGLKK